MEKQRKFKTIGIVALIVAVIGLTVAFAALSQTLTINGTGKVTASTWDVVWEEIDNKGLETSSGVGVTSGYPKLNDNPLVKNNNAELTGTNLNFDTLIFHKPNDYASLDINISNKGDIDANLASITVPDLTGTVTGTAYSYSDYITISVTDFSNNALSLPINLAHNQSIGVRVKISFNNVDNEMFEALPNGVLELPFLDDFTFTVNQGTVATTTTTQAQQVQLYDVRVNDLTGFTANDYNPNEMYLFGFVDQNDVTHAFFIIPAQTAGTSAAYLQYTPDTDQDGTFYVYFEGEDKWKLVENYNGTETRIDSDELVFTSVKLPTAEEYALMGVTPFTSQMISDIFTITEVSN